MPLLRCRASRESNPILAIRVPILQRGTSLPPCCSIFTDSALICLPMVYYIAPTSFRRFGYHSRVILPVFAVVAYALACVYSSLLTPVIALWSHGRGLFRKVHPLAGQVRLVGCRCRRKPPSFGPCGPLRVPSHEPWGRLEPTPGRVRPTRFSLFNGPLALCHVLLTIIYF